jgi:hypothetical protein
MNSEFTEDFLTCFRRLPERIKRQAKKNYKVWKANPRHPGSISNLLEKSLRSTRFALELDGEQSGLNKAIP